MTVATPVGAAPPSSSARGAAAASRKRTWRMGPWLQLAPASLYFLVLFVIPIGFLVAYSFFTARDFRFVAELTIDNYVEVVTSDIFRAFFIRTLRLAAIVSTIVILVCYPFTYIITYVFPARRQFLYFMVLVSLFGGYLVRIYAWRSILGRQGALNQSLIAAGVIEEPLRYFLNSQFAVIIALVSFLIPLGVLPMFSAMQNISPSLIEAARDLGSSRIHAAIKIVLPLSMRGVRAAFAFCFIASAAEWVTPSLLGGTNDQLVGNMIAYQFGGGLNWPLGAALAVTLAIVVVAVLSVVLSLLKRLSA